MIFIYSLSDPRTDEVRYIGKTKNLKQRLHNHCNKLHNTKSYKRNWINKLKQEGFRPVMHIIDEVQESEWHYWEKFWIEQMRQWGFKLVNHTIGGEGLTSGNQTSFKRGHKPWNSGTRKIKDKKGRNSKSDETTFKKGFKPWNTGKNIKVKPDKNVFQYSHITGEFIYMWKTARVASIALNINEEGIGQCARGKAKSAGGYYWAYTEETPVIPIFKRKTNYKILNSLK